MAKQERFFNEQDFESVQKELLEEIELVTGKGQERPRFKGFRVVEAITEMFEQGLELYEAGQIHESVVMLQRTLGSLQWRQREYFRRSAEKHFCEVKDALVAKGLTRDLTSRLDKAIDKINRHARSSQDFDLSEASHLYWRTEQIIDDIEAEHAGRLRKQTRTAQKKANLAAKAEEEVRQQEQLERQRLHDQEMAQRRSATVSSVRGRLAALMSA